MESIAISELRANLMKVLKEIRQGSRIDITSRGKVIARLVPPENLVNNARARLNELSKTAIVDDVVSPVATDWHAQQ